MRTQYLWELLQRRLPVWVKFAIRRGRQFREVDAVASWPRELRWNLLMPVFNLKF